MNAEYLVFRTLSTDLEGATAEIALDIHILGSSTDLKGNKSRFEGHSIADSWNCGIRSRIDEFEEALEEISDEADDYFDDIELLDAVSAIEIEVDENYVSAADLHAIDYQENPKKVFYKEQCFLLSFLDYFVEHKIRGDSRGISSRQDTDLEAAMLRAFADDGLTGQMIQNNISIIRDAAERMERGRDFDTAVDRAATRGQWRNWRADASRITENQLSIARGVIQRQGAELATHSALRSGWKRLPYLPGNDAYNGNASVLCDGDPYAFVNRLIMHPAQKSFMNVHHSVLSQLQPKIRLYLSLIHI